MRTVGVILHEARLAKNLTLEEVERSTKIRAKFLAAMEADDFRKLPTPGVIRGFVNNYAEFLGLNKETVLAFLRRQLSEVSRASLLPKAPAEPLNRSLFQLTPGRFLMILLGTLATIFLTYLGLQYRQISQPPNLNIESPKDQLVSSDKRVEILGKTDPDATILINGVSTLVRSDGRFFDTFTLEPGANTITIVATSRFAKTTSISRVVRYQP